MWQSMRCCTCLCQGAHPWCVLVQAEHDRRLADLEASFAEMLAARKVALETEMRRQLEGLRQQQAALEAQVQEQVGGAGTAAASVHLARRAVFRAHGTTGTLSQLRAPMRGTGAV